ncbi:MAG: acyl carrier protein [Alphaproteobacteria bacterium]|nr:acyl carrier protein [Alphaproteobacteria bacterium]
MSDIVGGVLDIIADKAKADRSTLSPQTELSSLNMDSLDIVEVFFQLEEHFSISIPYNANDAADPAGAGLNTINDVIEIVRRQLAGDREAT